MNTPDIARLQELWIAANEPPSSAENLDAWSIHVTNARNELLASIPALLDHIERAEGGWHDIATAPRDGTLVLLWVVHPNAEYAAEKAMWLGPVVGQWIGHNGGGWTWHGMFGAPTHWCPIGAPPLDSNRIEGA